MNVLCSALALGVLAFAPPESDRGYNYRGRVLKADDQDLILMVGTESVRFVVHAEARVILDGTPSSLDKLKPGFLARVESDRLGDRLIARRIFAETAAVVRTQVPDREELRGHHDKVTATSSQD